LFCTFRIVYFVIVALLIAIFHAYVAYAVYYDHKKALPVLIALILGYLYVFYTFAIEPLANRNADKIEWVEKKVDSIVEYKVKSFPVLQRFDFCVLVYHQEVLAPSSLRFLLDFLCGSLLTRPTKEFVCDH
jgi:hypothetical protein